MVSEVSAEPTSAPAVQAKPRPQDTEIEPVGWGCAAGRCVALGYVRGAAAAVSHAGTPVTVDLWGQAVGARAWDRWSAQAR